LSYLCINQTCLIFDKQVVKYYDIEIADELMSKKVNTITLIIILLIFSGWYFNLTSLYYLIPLAILYIVINIVGSANIQFNYFFSSYCRSATTKKEIAITFDDGPHPEVTLKLISLLNSHNVKATFFCIGKNASEHHNIISEMVNNEHLVGNHSYNHSNVFNLRSSKNMQKEILETNHIITSIIGKSPILFRPPFGVANPMLSRAISRTNMVSVGWSLRSFDTVKEPEAVIAKLMANTKPGDVVLFHDTNPNIITIIEEYLLWLNKNDFKIVSLTSLLNIEAYEV